MSEGPGYELAGEDALGSAPQEAASLPEAADHSVDPDLRAVESFAHRTRSSLTTIGAAADYLLGGDLDPSKHREMLSMISGEVRTIDQLVSDLLVVARQGGVMDARLFSPVELAAVARRAVHSLASYSQLVGAWLAVDGAQPCPPVLGDERLLHQAVLSALRSVISLARAGDRVVASVTPVPAEAGQEARVRLLVGLDSPRDDAAEMADALTVDQLPMTAARLIAVHHGGSFDLLSDRPGVLMILPAASYHQRPMAQAVAAAGSQTEVSMPDVRG